MTPPIKNREDFAKYCSGKLCAQVIAWVNQSRSDRACLQEEIWQQLAVKFDNDFTFLNVRGIFVK